MFFDQTGGGGGGFLSGSPELGGPTSSPQSNSLKRGKSGAAHQSVLPVTIKQLLTAHQNPDESFTISGKTLHHVTFVGWIKAISDVASGATFELTDGTGWISAKIWLDREDQQDNMTRLREMLREEQYVRVIGSLRNFNEKRSLNAYHIKPLSDFNQLTHHFLEVIFVHLQAESGGGGGGAGGVPGNEMMFGGFQQQQQNVAPYFADPLQQAVMQVLYSSHAQEGLSVSFICQQLGRSEAEVRDCLEVLSSEGQAFSTIDEDHYKVTG